MNPSVPGPRAVPSRRTAPHRLRDVAGAAGVVGWTLAARRRARRRLAAGPPLRPLDLVGARHLPASRRPVVERTLRRTGATCLERCVVLQAWDQAHGVARSVLIGVRRDGALSELGAHAWLDDEEPPAGEGFVELARISPTARLEPVGPGA